EIAALLDHYRVRLVLYPSVGPETFSYTLSEAWAAGRPALVPPIGALAERVAATGGGWVLHDGEWEDEKKMLDRVTALLDPDASAVWEETAARARRAPQPTLAGMAEATIGIWRDALARAPARVHLQPIAAARCLEALHYVPWHPPAPELRQGAAPDAPSPNGALALAARAARAIRHTLPGKVLYRLTPKVLVDALRERL